MIKIKPIIVKPKAPLSNESVYYTTIPF